VGGWILKYVLEWLYNIAVSYIKKETKINKKKKAIEDQVERVKLAADRAQNGGEIEKQELIDSARDLANNF